MLSIRPATPEDVPTLVELIRELAEFERLPVSVTSESLIRDGFRLHPKFRVLLAEWEHVTVGYAFFFGFYSTFEGRAGIYLEDVYVRPGFRGRGAGRALFSEIARLARREGCFAVRWQVLDWNRPAIEFYQRLGATFLDDWKTVELDERACIAVAEGGP
jgi:GNAT superfamily N-acetyltransferase